MIAALPRRWLVVGGAALAVASLAGLYVWRTGAELDRLREDRGRLEQALEVQRQATASAVASVVSWRDAYDRAQRAFEGLAQAQREAAEENRRLRDVLAEHDLGALAARKPGLVERRVNDGTARALRMLERATDPDGAP